MCLCASRRRHTRSQGDWSSDVCASDLGPRPGGRSGEREAGNPVVERLTDAPTDRAEPDDADLADLSVRHGNEATGRSEERRVGKVCRTGWKIKQRTLKQGLGK